MASNTDIVEEFPHPPFYFKCFQAEDSLSPPDIPSTNPYLRAFQGSFAYVHENTPSADHDCDYRADLKRLVNRFGKALVNA